MPAPSNLRSHHAKESAKESEESSSEESSSEKEMKIINKSYHGKTQVAIMKSMNSFANLNDRI